jgi:AAA domain
VANAAVQMPQKRRALASVRKGVLDTPVRVLVYGAEKVGKSTFAAGAPSPIFLGAENGTERLDVERLQPSSWSEAMSWLGELATEKHDYRTLVVDPLGWLEPMCWADFLGDSGSIDAYDGGFGRGYNVALDRWRVFVLALERCWRQRTMHIVLVAHSLVKSFANPEGPAFDRYEVALHAKAAGLLKQWADAVLFARLETFVSIDKKTKRALGQSSGARVLYTQPCAAYDAGSRWKLPEQIPLSWDDFYGAVQAEGARAGELAQQIVALCGEIGDEKVTTFSAGFVEKNKSNADKLAELLNRLNVKLEEKRKENAT